MPNRAQTRSTGRVTSLLRVLRCQRSRYRAAQLEELETRSLVPLRSMHMFIIASRSMKALHESTDKVITRHAHRPTCRQSSSKRNLLKGSQQAEGAQVSWHAYLTVNAILYAPFTILILEKANIRSRATVVSLDVDTTTVNRVQSH